MAIRNANWYDHPAYYDLAFCSETTLEADFIEAACRKYCPFAARRLLEPACGTGRLIAELAVAGIPDVGLRSERIGPGFLPATAYAEEIAGGNLFGRHGRFRTPLAESPTKAEREGREGGIDAAYNTFDSFRHLLTEESARSHLQCVARCVRPQGLYILGFHLLPPDASEECIERWTERQGRTQVTVTLRVLATDRRKRIETLRISLLARDKGEIIRLRDEFRFRMYTAAQFRRLLASTPEWELCDVYDFWYEIDHPLKLNNEMSDTVFILRRK